MLKLRKILLCDKLYYLLFILSFLITGIRLLLPRTSFYQEDSTTFIGVVTKIIQKEDKVTIYIKNKETIIGSFYQNQENTISLGDKIKIIGSFQRPMKNTTKYLFNYQKYLERNNIFYLVNISSYQIVSKNKSIYYFLKEKIIHHMEKDPYLLTFLLGDKSYIKDSVKTSYQENGISHLFAISGMHISLLAELMKKILKRFHFREEKIFHFTSIILIFYLFLVGFSPSILRGVLFYILFSINRIYYFYIKPCNLFLGILSFSLLYHPNYLLDNSFLYSYTISFALIQLSSFLKSKSRIKSLLKVSSISFLVSLPITLYYYNEINFLSIFYNLLFVPLVSTLIFPMSLVVFILKPLMPIYHFLIHILENLSLFLGKISIGKILFKRLPLPIYFLYYGIVIYFVLKPKRKTLIFLFVLLLIHFSLPHLDRSDYVNMIDVGQGDSILIHSNHKNILIDTGGIISYHNDSSNLFYSTLLPVLRSEGIKKIDSLVLTHGDYDHMGEAINLVNNFKVEKVIFNCGEFNDLEKNLIKVLDKKKIPYYSCIKELNIDSNKLYFLQTKEYDNENDNSNVIYTEIKGYKFMFMGDASITTEKEILKKYNLSNIDVLKVGHHGSKTSSGKDFINVINPSYSIISVGKNNRYGHPNKEILVNLKDSKIYRTDQDGSIMFKIKNNKMKIETCSP